jgi:phosphatidylglycerol:prolipoprotein diacylglycerol transferase
MLVLPVIPFPAIGPVLIAIGPFAVRWYALAYIVGIIGGWFYARAIISSPKLWGGPAPLTVTDFDDFVIWITLPNGGPLPRHPSQLYEAALEGVVLFIVVGLLVRSGALKRPGIVTGVFALGYGLARITCEFFREPDVQLGFLWGGMTMGMLLCIPLILGGIAILVIAFQRLPKTKNG